MATSWPWAFSVCYSVTAPFFVVPLGSVFFTLDCAACTWLMVILCTSHALQDYVTISPMFYFILSLSWMVLIRLFSPPNYQCSLDNIKQICAAANWHVHLSSISHASHLWFDCHHKTHPPKPVGFLFQTAMTAKQLKTFTREDVEKVCDQRIQITTKLIGKQHNTEGDLVWYPK